MTEPYWSDDTVTLYLGDCREVLAMMPDASVDAVCTDPPYEIGFMGRGWDASGIAFNPDVWKECLRVLKPGGHLLAFGAPRAYHRMAVAIEDAGFEIRDSIGYASGVLAWCYGSGFPKSRNISQDLAFCQCMPPVRGGAAEEAAESAARLLLADLRRNGQAVGANIADLHGVPVNLHPDYAIPSRSQQDVQPGLCSDSDIANQEGAALGQRPAGEGCLCPVRDDRDEVAQQTEAQRADLLLNELSSESECGDAACERVRRNRDDAYASLRGGQPGLEGRGDLQAPEGQLHRPPVCALPAGSFGDGSIGRLHHGAPSRDGSLGRSPVAANGSGQPHRPESAQQRSGEPGAVSVERGSQARRGWPVCAGCGKPVVPAGLGTALKPAWEPIVLARRPLDGTVAANVLEHGTGALNIDACRIETGSRPLRLSDRTTGNDVYGDGLHGSFAAGETTQGRWPANVVFTHSASCVEGYECDAGCTVAELDRQSGVRRAGGDVSGNEPSSPAKDVYGEYGRVAFSKHRDTGGASRFFPVFRYEAKAGSAERPKLDDGTAHATVKPLALMRWLVRLVTPPGGTVLDPFAGSGTTGEACVLEGFRAVLVELEQPHAELIRRRLSKPLQPSLDLFAVLTRDEEETRGH